MFSSLWRRLTRLIHRERCPECGRTVKETYCDVCGYDLVQRTRDETRAHHPGPRI
jgi:rRNA maturation endonuclease Nob1